MRRELLSAYLDGELDGSRRDRVEARLARSAVLRAELDQIRAARDAVRGLPTLDPPPRAWARLLDAVASVPDASPETEAQPVVVQLPRRSVRRPVRWAGAAAVAASLVLVAVVPSDDDVVPDVTAFVDAHSASTSLVDDPVSSLAGVGVTVGSP